MLWVAKFLQPFLPNFIRLKFPKLCVFTLLFLRVMQCLALHGELDILDDFPRRLKFSIMAGSKVFVYVVLMNNRWFVTRILWMRTTCERYRRSEPRVICCPGCQAPGPRPPARRGPAQSQARFCPAAGCGDTTGSGPATCLG